MLTYDEERRRFTARNKALRIVYDIFATSSGSPITVLKDLLKSENNS